MKKSTGMLIASAFSAAAIYNFAYDPLNLNAVFSSDEKEAVAKGYKTSRGLTNGETELVQSIFGDAVDTESVEIRSYDQFDEDIKSNVVNDSTSYINVYGQDNYSKDYSQSEDYKIFGLFTYEMTRIWQNQNDVNFTVSRFFGKEYRLASIPDFNSLGPYQQAAAIMDYSSRILHDEHKTIVLGENNCGRYDYVLKRVVEAAFPQAAATRKALERQYERPMTKNEAALAQLIFQDEINANEVVMQMNPRACSDKSASVRNSHNILFWGEKNHRQDYGGLDMDLMQFGSPKYDTMKYLKEQRRSHMFVHELTHVWQYQAEWKNTNVSPFNRVVEDDIRKLFNMPSRYEYEIEKDSVFTDYGTEQQAAIISDYVIRYFYEERRTNYVSKLSHLVEAHFPHMMDVRRYLE